MSVAERVADLLFAFGTHSHERSVSELSRHVGREKSQVSRMLKSMERGGLVTQNSETKKYRLAWRVRLLGGTAGDDALARMCKPVLQKLVAKTGEVALLSVQDGVNSLTVLRAESHRRLQAGGWVGRRSPMHCTASGRALLFDTSDTDIGEMTEAVIGSSDYLDSAPGDLPTLVERLRHERELGYCVASEEVESGLTSIGVPVRGLTNEILGAINISGPTSRLFPLRRETGALLLSASKSVTTSLRKLSEGVSN